MSYQGPVWQLLCFACFLTGGNQALLLLRKPPAEEHLPVPPQLPAAAAVAITLLLGPPQETLLFQGASQTGLQEELRVQPVGPAVLCQPLWPGLSG